MNVAEVSEIAARYVVDALPLYRSPERGSSPENGTMPNGEGAKTV